MIRAAAAIRATSIQKCGSRDLSPAAPPSSPNGSGSTSGAISSTVATSASAPAMAVCRPSSSPRPFMTTRPVRVMSATCADDAANVCGSSPAPMSVSDVPPAHAAMSPTTLPRGVVVAIATGVSSLAEPAHAASTSVDAASNANGTGRDTRAGLLVENGYQQHTWWRPCAPLLDPRGGDGPSPEEDTRGTTNG